jgi:SulP family sulfate permease
MRDVLALDATGLDALEDLMEKLRKHQKELVLCGPHSQPLFALTRSGLLDRLGMDNVCADMDASLERANKILADRKAGTPPTLTGSVESDSSSPSVH